MAASLRGGGGGGGSSTATNSPVGDWTHISNHKIAGNHDYWVYYCELERFIVLLWQLQLLDQSVWHFLL